MNRQDSPLSSKSHDLVSPSLFERAERTDDTSSNARSWKFFVDKINMLWRKGAGDFITCGQLLIEAKDELQRDAYKAMLKKLHFEASVAKKLICVAKKTILGAHVHLLPPCWSTLYELSQLKDDALNAALADGSIHPGMHRRDAVALRKPPRTTTSSPSTPLSKAAWSKATVEERRRFLDAIGADPLCAVFSIALRAELRRRVGGQQRAKTSALGDTITKALQQALSLQKVTTTKDAPAMGVASALNAVNNKLNSHGLDLNNITIVIDPAAAHRKAA